ncbi:MAG TPA: NAD(P)-dependent alcohol dehydrogenase [Acidimicrobiales bacterium]
MKAAVVTRYGPPEVVEVRDVPTPEPGEGEVRVRAHVTTVSSGDSRVRALRVPRGMGLAVRLKFGWSAPKQPILGVEAAGEVDAVGPGVERWQVGDRVVVSRGFDFGCHAEHVVVAQDGTLARIPDGWSYADAVALLFGGGTALTFFDLGKPVAGERILVNGASGAVGTMAVQLAKHRGLQVTAVCSGANAELVESLGADEVLDHTKVDVTRGADRYDLIMDTHGSTPFGRMKGQLKPGGRFLMVSGGLGATIAAGWQKPVHTTGMNADPVGADAYEELMALAGNGVLRPVIDRTVPLADIAEAHRRVDGGHKVGAVVVALDGG